MHKEKDIEAPGDNSNQPEQVTQESPSGPQDTDHVTSGSAEPAGLSGITDDSSDDALDNPAIPAEKPPLWGILPEVAAAGVESFDDLPLHETVRQALRTIGWAAPTPVQKLCLPYTLRGRHVAGFAQTGTGKTAVFLLTICHQILSKMAEAKATKSSSPDERTAEGVLKVRAVVLAPTRELAMQIEQDAEVMLANAGLTSLTVIGGMDYDKQVKRIKEGVDVIFATPGRLKDYVQKRYVDLSAVQVFVCDEADRMFDMGFIEDVEFFLAKLPETCQRLLFSATTNDEVKELAFEYLETPEYISVNPEEITPEKIVQYAYHCHATEKLRVMLGMLAEHQPDCAIVFTNTKLTAEWLHFKLENNGIEADLITGDLPQNKRIKLIQRIKDGKLKALIATDVASRGLHISRITHVYNFDLPEEPANYIHRIGRTARAGAKGNAYSLVCDDYGHNFSAINELLGPNGTIETHWPPEAYLTLEDKAGNPFAERYKAWQEQKERNAAGRSRRPEGAFEGGRDRGGYGGPSSGRNQNQSSQRGPRSGDRGEGGERNQQYSRDRSQSAANGGGRRGSFQGPKGTSEGGSFGRDQNAGGRRPHQGQRGGPQDGASQGAGSFRSRDSKGVPRRGGVDASQRDRRPKDGQGQGYAGRTKNDSRPGSSSRPYSSGPAKSIETQKPSFLQLFRRLIKAVFGWSSKK